MDEGPPPLLRLLEIYDMNETPPLIRPSEYEINPGTATASNTQNSDKFIFMDKAPPLPDYFYYE